ncbi:Uncharacterised protein [Mycobacteroides abscessus subsp. abscessus]|nr:Uncharacterised protein [Mycobacteroides abscessus subsp. abscessus]
MVPASDAPTSSTTASTTPGTAMAARSRHRSPLLVSSSSTISQATLGMIAVKTSMRPSSSASEPGVTRMASSATTTASG